MLVLSASLGGCTWLKNVNVVPSDIDVTGEGVGMPGSGAGGGSFISRDGSPRSIDLSE